jgi:ADP-ribose pyrophosphatase YjhB (NUDIX family)
MLGQRPNEIAMRPAELFRFCPRCAAPRPAENRAESPLRCVACGLVFFFNPTVAAAAFLADSAGRVLFIRRAREPSAGKLGVPGGFIDFGESAEEGLRREVGEEVGVAIDQLAFLVSVPNLYDYREVTYPVVDLYFTAVVVNPGLARPLDGVAGIEWRRPRDVPDEEIAFSSLRMALKTLKPQE